MPSKGLFTIVLAIIVPSIAARLGAQAGTIARSNAGPRIEVAVTFAAEHSFRANTDQSFWLKGGSAELGSNFYKGFGLAAGFTGLTASSIGNSNIPLSLITATVGPRFRVAADRPVSLYGEALVGDANAFHSQFPGSSGVQTSANSFALQAGGGVDLNLRSHFAIRGTAAYVLTMFPNAGTNRQNNLQVGGGLVYRFYH